MASEAQRLIGISLAKIAQSRVGRGGVSLHKNLLVATVLQKARYIFMEEAYYMVHGHYPPQCRQFIIQHHSQIHQHQQYCHIEMQQQQQLIGSNYTSTLESQKSSVAFTQNHPTEQYDNRCDEILNVQMSEIKTGQTLSNDQNYLSSSIINPQPLSSSVIVRNEFVIGSNKENNPPANTGTSTSSSSSNLSPASTLTYLDLDNKMQRHVDANDCLSISNTSSTNETSLKRRRAISEYETEEAVLSILPKRTKSESFIDDISETVDDSSSLTQQINEIDKSDIFKELTSTNCFIMSTVSGFDDELDHTRHQENSNIFIDDGRCANETPMEIDRITSLVSIFSFGNLTRSVSTPDLCSSQAKDESTNQFNHQTQRANFLAMAV